jgi:DNA-binding PadR family transcriptional regulator
MHFQGGGCGPHNRHGRHAGPGRRGPFDPFGGWDLGEGSPGEWGRGIGGRGFGGPGFGGRGRKRMFDGGELRLVLLKLIADQPRHGYDLIREIEELTGGAYAPSPGVVYPTLTLLEDMGHIVPKPGEGARKAFEATAEGQAFLAENAEQVAALIARLADIGERRAAGDPSSIRRAMGNLAAVLRDRGRAGALAGEAGHAVADILDEAARRIERL